MLAAGYPPTKIRPWALVHYWPLMRTDQDLVGGYDLTAFNTPTWADHPPVSIPAWYRRRGHWLPAAVGGATALPAAMIHYRRRRA